MHVGWTGRNAHCCRFGCHTLLDMKDKFAIQVSIQKQGEKLCGNVYLALYSKATRYLAQSSPFRYLIVRVFIWLISIEKSDSKSLGELCSQYSRWNGGIGYGI